MTKADDATREELVAEHSALLGEGVPQQIDDPLRNYEAVISNRLAATSDFLQGEVFQHLPKSAHPEFVKRLKAAL